MTGNAGQWFAFLISAAPPSDGVYNRWENLLIFSSSHKIEHNRRNPALWPLIRNVRRMEVCEMFVRRCEDAVLGTWRGMTTVGVNPLIGYQTAFKCVSALYQLSPNALRSHRGVFIGVDDWRRRRSPRSRLHIFQHLHRRE